MTMTFRNHDNSLFRVTEDPERLPTDLQIDVTELRGSFFYRNKYRESSLK
jgi:hypothetical protein